MSRPTGVAAAPLPGAAEEFLVWMAVEKGRAANTLEAYRRDLRRYVAWLQAPETATGTTTVTAATEADVTAYVASLRASGLAPASVARAVVVVRALHRYMATERLADIDPTVRLETPRRPSGLPKALSEAQIARLFDAVATNAPLDSHQIAVRRRDSALLEVLYGSGLRISEAVGLSLGDIDLDSRFIRAFGKGSKERVVPLGSLATAALESWFADGVRDRLAPPRWRSRDDQAAVFLNQRGGRLTRQGGWLVLSGYARLAGLSDVVSPHVLRHSCATHMLDHGADIRAVQELLGHASISTTQLYTKVVTDRLWAVYAQSHPRARR